MWQAEPEEWRGGSGGGGVEGGSRSAVPARLAWPRARPRRMSAATAAARLVLGRARAARRAGEAGEAGPGGREPELPELPAGPSTLTQLSCEAGGLWEPAPVDEAWAAAGGAPYP